MCNREGRDDAHERPYTPNRHDQAEQEQQVIDADDQVPGSHAHETRGRVPPARLETQQPLVSLVQVGTLPPIGVDATQQGRRTHAQMCEAGLDGQPRVGRGHRILQQHIQQDLGGRDLEGRVECRRGKRCECVGRVVKRPIRWKGGTDGGHATLGQRRSVGVQRDGVRHPQLRGIAQGAVGTGEVQETRPAQRKLHIAHRLERCAHENAVDPAIGQHKRLDRYAAGHLMRSHRSGCEQQQSRRQRQGAVRQGAVRQHAVRQGAVRTGDLRRSNPPEVTEQGDHAETHESLDRRGEAGYFMATCKRPTGLRLA